MDNYFELPHDLLFCILAACAQVGRKNTDRGMPVRPLRVPYHSLSGKIWKRVDAISMPKDSRGCYPKVSTISWSPLIPDTCQQVSISSNITYMYSD